MGRRFCASGKSPIVNSVLFFESSDISDLPLCLSQREIFVIRSYLFPFSRWRTRFARPISGKLWEEASQEEYWLFQDALDALEEKIGMSTGCFDVLGELSVSLAQIAAKMGSTGASGGSVACGCSIPPDTIIDPPPAPDLGNPETDPPPDGFDTWEEYQVYKCKAANAIADSLIGTIGNMASIPGVVSGMAAGLLYLVVSAAFFGTGASSVAVGLLALGLGSAAGIAIAITALVAIAVAGIGGLAYFSTLSSVLQGQKSDIVCELYSASSVEEARSALLSRVDDAIAGIEGITEFISDKLNEVVAGLMGMAIFNTLFEPSDYVASHVGSVDCENCGCSWVIDAGELSTGNLESGTFEVVSVSVDLGGTVRERVVLTAPALSCGECHQLEVVDVAGWTEPPYGVGSGFFDCEGNFGPAGPLGNGIITSPVDLGVMCVQQGQQVILQSTASFTVSLTIGGDCV